MSQGDLPDNSVDAALSEMRHDIKDILGYISGTSQCAVAKLMSDSMTKISKAIDLLVEQNRAMRKDVDELADTVFGKADDKSDTGLRGMVRELVQEMRIIKWVGGILAGTGLAALVTYWIQILLMHGGNLIK